ncbi:MAG: SPFH domain-containing protein [Candidatus Poribacteria bacterium]|nr:SPFH domain-containing protein [Candidatus Poribacteria bacterium]
MFDQLLAMLTGQAFSAAGGVLGIIAFFMFIILLKVLIHVCPPNQVLVVTGIKSNVGGKEYGFRLQRGGWTFVLPYFQSVQTLDLSIIQINVRVEGVNAANGITVGADATAGVCVDHEDETLLYSAVERLMGKSRPEIQDQIQQTMVGNFRGALNKATPLQAIGMIESVDDEDRLGEGQSLVALAAQDDSLPDAEGERAQFRYELLRDGNQDLASFGMRVVSVSLQKIWDTSNYISNLADKTLSRKRQEVEIEEARLRARAERAESDSRRRQTIAENEANEKIIAQEQQLEVLRRKCEAEIEQSRLEADGAISSAQSRGEQGVQAISVDLRKLKNSSEITLEAEWKRQAADVLADGENKAIQIVQETQNSLLYQKARMIAESGDVGKIALFVNQQLPHLFAAYREHAQSLELDQVVVMDDEDGINRLLNRGPEAFVDFLKFFEGAFGIRVKDLVSATTQPSVTSGEARS